MKIFRTLVSIFTVAWIVALITYPVQTFLSTFLVIMWLVLIWNSEFKPLLENALKPKEVQERKNRKFDPPV